MDKNDVVFRLLDRIDPKEEDDNVIMESAKEILMLRTKLEKIIGITLCIENILGSTLPDDQFDNYYKGEFSIHKKFKQFLDEVDYE